MSDLGSGIVFGIFALLVLSIGDRRGFFKISSHSWPVPIGIFSLIGAFAIYFIGSVFLPQVFIALWQKKIMLNYMSYANWLNFSLSFFVFVCLVIYFFALPQKLRKGIFHRAEDKHPLINHVWAALYTWIMAFPLVLFLNHILEYIISKFFQIPKLPEQIAVKFLKSTFSHPLYFILAMTSIVILAPIIEELLFRGFLQTYIRQHLGRVQAIIITSVCFAFFHYAAGQGLGNISIILSLFVLSLFIGFIYEKQGSLIAPMVLHAAFNTISVINLALFENNNL